MFVDGIIAGLLFVGFGYSVGSIPFGVIAGRRHGVEVRTQGSGNIGATNVARTVGKGTGALVLCADAAKGAVPILCWLHLPHALGSPWWLLAVGIAPVVGHCFSPWLGFGGGKGVATALGVFLALDPAAAGIAVATFAVLYAAARVVSLGSILGSISIAVFAAVVGRSQPHIALAVATAVLIIIRHRANLRRLLGRVELKL